LGTSSNSCHRPVSVARGNCWALDVGYRALFMDGMSSTIDTNSFVSSTTQLSVATLGETWEHQVRIGVCASHLVTPSLCAREHQQAQARVRGSKAR